MLRLRERHNGPAKGLRNKPGDNNCFLNVVIQGLWHLQLFKEQFLASDHRHKTEAEGEACLTCCLQAIFADYQYGEDAVVEPSAMRQVFARLYRHLDRFQLRKTADASEAMDSVLSTLHQEISKGVEPCPPCLVHSCFSIEVCEQIHCSHCKESSEPVTSSAFQYFLPVITVEQSVEHALRSRCVIPDVGDILSIHASEEDMCPNESCRKPATRKTTILNTPQVFLVSLAWNTASASVDQIRTVLEPVNLKLSLENLNKSVPESELRFILQGMICYYGCHYVAFFYNSIQRTWVMFDDATVRPVGDHWEDVRDRCLVSRYQPAILLYANLSFCEAALEPLLRKKEAAHACPPRARERPQSEGASLSYVPRGSRQSFQAEQHSSNAAHTTCCSAADDLGVQDCPLSQDSRRYSSSSSHAFEVDRTDNCTEDPVDVSSYSDARTPSIDPPHCKKLGVAPNVCDHSGLESNMMHMSWTSEGQGSPSIDDTISSGWTHVDGPARSLSEDDYGQVGQVTSLSRLDKGAKCMSDSPHKQEQIPRPSRPSETIPAVQDGLHSQERFEMLQRTFPYERRDSRQELPPGTREPPIHGRATIREMKKLEAELDQYLFSTGLERF
eukprot:Rmarinus@m.16478